VQTFINNVTYPYNTEVYAQYTIGISNHISDGIHQFNRFSVVNPGGIILPVNIISLTAQLQGAAVALAWTSLNELNVAYYEVEHSGDARSFISMGRVAALNNGMPKIDYTFTDEYPGKGDNYYRIKAVDKDGSYKYTNIVK